MKRRRWIYKITSPSGKVYIGQTCNIDRRLSDYIAMRCKSQTKLYRSLLKYGYETHCVEILFDGVCSKQFINTLEQSWIKKLNSVRNGLNITVGGIVAISYKEAKSLLPKENKLRKLYEISEEKRLRRSELAKQNNAMHNPISKEKMIRAVFEAVSKSPNGYLGTRRKLSEHQYAKPVAQYDMNGNFIAKYGCAKEAAIAIGASKSSVGRVALGKQKSLYGYKFTFI